MEDNELQKIVEDTTDFLAKLFLRIIEENEKENVKKEIEKNENTK